MNARQYFQGKFGESCIPGREYLERLSSICHFSSEYYSDISKNFAPSLKRLGNIFAGDEKLFKFTGVCPYIRFVVSKKSRIGLWIYEGNNVIIYIIISIYNY